MSRKTNLNHRLWYVRKRHGNITGYIIIVVVLILIVLFLSYAEKRLKVSLEEISSHKAKGIVTTVVNSAVLKGFPDNINYEEIAMINRDINGRISSIQTDVSKLNRIFAGISLDIQNELSQIEDQEVKIPLGVMLGESIFSGRGPKIGIKIIPGGNVQTDFRSEFEEAGINQTKHRIYLMVKTSVSVVAPFMKEKTEIVTSIPLAETVIVGDVPQVYLRDSETSK